MTYIELSWLRDHGRLVHIDSRIADLVGWDVEEFAAIAGPAKVLMPDLRSLEAHPGKMAAQTSALTLRHKNGSDVHCESTCVCRYDGDGQFVEAWGCIRQCPQHHLFNQVIAWWKEATDEARQAIADSISLYPSPVAL